MFFIETHCISQLYAKTIKRTFVKILPQMYLLKKKKSLNTAIF